jgi:hypothetical protein
MKKMTFALQWIILSTLCSVCMIGCGQSLYMAKPDLYLKGEKTVTVVTIDQRSYILDKSKEPHYISTIRGALGNPLSYYTDKDKPVAEEVAQVVASALMKNGFKTKTISVQPSNDLTDANSKIKENPSDRSILIRIKELRSDSWGMFGLTDGVYAELHLQIFNAENKELAQNTVKFEGTVGTSRSIGDSLTNVSDKIKLLLEELMNKEEVKMALQ